MTFGIIIHYGVYSFYAYDDVVSARRRKTQNGSEWYYSRLIETGTFRPISGHLATKQHHNEMHPGEDYFTHINKLVTDPNKIAEWVRIAKIAGATYLILTTKHHDGVCLWNTQTTLRKSEMDICRVFVDECKKQGIEPGFYYSWFEVDTPFTVKYFQSHCIPQLVELMSYNPKYMWFDGHWKMTQKGLQRQARDIISNMTDVGIIVNDRVGGFDPMRDMTPTTIRVFEDRHLPTEPLNIPWEHVNTIGLSWGYNKEQRAKDFKTYVDICTLRAQIIAHNGNLLLNLGPMHTGDICPEELDAILPCTANA